MSAERIDDQSPKTDIQELRPDDPEWGDDVMLAPFGSMMAAIGEELRRASDGEEVVQNPVNLGSPGVPRFDHDDVTEGEGRDHLPTLPDLDGVDESDDMERVDSFAPFWEALNRNPGETD